MTTTLTGFPTILKSGERKGQTCGKPSKFGVFCGTHKRKDQFPDDNPDTDTYLGQYFTTSEKLQRSVFDLISNKDKSVPLLEPSFGAII